jgi:hypothetical protein
MWLDILETGRPFETMQNLQHNRELLLQMVHRLTWKWLTRPPFYGSINDALSMFTVIDRGARMGRSAEQQGLASPMRSALRAVKEPALSREFARAGR